MVSAREPSLNRQTDVKSNDRADTVTKNTPLFINRAVVQTFLDRSCSIGLPACAASSTASAFASLPAHALAAMRIVV